MPFIGSYRTTIDPPPPPPPHTHTHTQYMPHYMKKPTTTECLLLQILLGAVRLLELKNNNRPNNERRERTLSASDLQRSFVDCSLQWKMFSGFSSKLLVNSKKTGKHRATPYITVNERISCYADCVFSPV